MKTTEFYPEISTSSHQNDGQNSNIYISNTDFPDNFPVNFPENIADFAPKSLENSTNDNFTSQYFPKISVRFYLYNTKSNAPTNILCYVRINDCRERFNTHLKCYPSQWNKESQTIKALNPTNALTLHNNTTLNYVINRIQILKSEFIAYICSRIQVLDDTKTIKLLVKQIKEVIIKYNPNVMNKKKKESIDYYNLFKALKNQAYKRKETTQKQYLCMINGLERYFKENKISDNLYDFDYIKAFNYKEYLNNCELAYSRCKVILRCIKTLIKEISNNPNFHYCYDPKIESLEIDEVKEKRSLQDKQQKQIVLSDEQIKALQELELTDKEEEVRDIFLLQCFTGARFSDISKLLNPANLIDNNGKKCVRYMDKKEGSRKKKMIFVNAPLFLHPSAESLWQKLVKTALTIDIETENSFNTILKRIAKKSGAFNEKKTFINARGQEVTKYPYEIISSHSGRHTFITRNSENLSPEDIITFTGHSDTRCVENHYLHRSEKLADCQLERVTNKVIKAKTEKTSSSLQSEKELVNIDSNIIIEEIKRLKYDLTAPQNKELELYKELFSDNEKYDKIAEISLYNDIENVREDFREEEI